MTDFERLRVMLEPKLGGWLSAAQIDDLVRYQLEQGVIVPPCKVGDTVYMSDNSTVETVKTVAITQDELGLYISIRQQLDGMTIDDNIPADAFGKIFFLNREAAEQSLKEREI